jgi:hypothetical protein
MNALKLGTEDLRRIKRIQAWGEVRVSTFISGRAGGGTEHLLEFEATLNIEGCPERIQPF